MNGGQVQDAYSPGYKAFSVDYQQDILIRSSSETADGWITIEATRPMQTGDPNDY